MTRIVILPGLDGTSAMLDGFCARLAARGLAAQAIAYPPGRALGYDELEAIAREALPRDAPYVLVGESFSGPLAIRLAALRPPGLLGLVLSTTFATAPLPLPVPRALAGLVRLAPARPPLPMLAWWLLGRWSTPALRGQLQAALATVAPAALRARAAATLRVDERTALARIDAPTLVLRATADRLLASAAPAVLAAGIRGARLVDVDGPHLLLQTAGDECADLIAQFVGTLRAVPAAGPVG